MNRNQELKKAAENFLKAANELQAVWNEAILFGTGGNTVLQANYPFEKSFDDVVADIDQWLFPVTVNYDDEVATRLADLGRDQLYTTMARMVADGEFQMAYDGTVVTDPWCDVTGRDIVDPIDYYGIENLIKATESYRR